MGLHGTNEVHTQFQILEAKDRRDTQVTTSGWTA
jgi:hypothetical protein